MRTRPRPKFWDLKQLNEMVQIVFVVTPTTPFARSPSEIRRKVYIASMHASKFLINMENTESMHGKFCKFSMQPEKSSEQIHAHLKKYSCSLENV